MITLEDTVDWTREVMAFDRDGNPDPLPSRLLFSLLFGVMFARKLGTRDQVHAAFLELAREFGLTKMRHFWIDNKMGVHCNGGEDISKIIAIAIVRGGR